MSASDVPAGSRVGLVMTLLPVATLTSILSVLLLLRGGVSRVPGMALVILAIVVPFLAWRAVARGQRTMLRAMYLASLSQVMIVLATMPATAEAPLRVVRLAIVLAALAGASTLTLGLARPVALRRAIALGIGVPVALLALDIVIGYPVVGDPPGRPEWYAAMQADTALGNHYPADIAFATSYPGPADGSHDPIDFRDRLWSLNTADGNVARLEFPPDSIGEVRVRIETADSGPSWHIQLNQAGLPVKALTGYSVRLRIRADSVREVGIGFLQAHAPWQQVGFYRTVQLDTTWHVLDEFFIAGINDDDTRLAFDLGGDTVGVTIAEVRMEDQDGSPLQPPLPLDQFEVRYAFDRDGCRQTGVPRAEGGTEVLLLGDGDAMGVGVRASETLAGRLASADSTGGGSGVAVRNCGVPGSDPANAAAWYRHLAQAHRPTTVLYVIGPALIDRLHRRAAASAVRRLPAPIRVSALLARLSPPGEADWRVAVAALARNISDLATAVGRDGGQLIVAYFRADDDRGWADLIPSVDGVLPSTGTTSIDLGTHLADSVPVARLLGEEPGRHPSPLAHRIAAEALRPALLGGAAGSGNRP